VIVLEDLVNPQEVDDELRDEVKSECEKFGELKSYITHLKSNGQGMRIFIEYLDK
jgi:hypothetical protein